MFKTGFNLSFGHPATDVCSTCNAYKAKIGSPELDDEQKRQESAMFILHRRQARTFYTSLNSVSDDSVTVCLDIMENLVLLKTPVRQSHYSRQLYLYVLGIVLHEGESSAQGKENVQLYVWGEHQNKKDSNMVASALHDCLTTVFKDSISRVNQLRVFRDSCYGQSKNIRMLSMLFALAKRLSVKVSFTFPVRGHSFLPADRVFGRIERDIRRQEMILMPADCHEILQRYGTVQVYQKDWTALDFKSAATQHTAVF